MLSLSNVTDLVETPSNPTGIRIINVNTRIPWRGRGILASNFYRLISNLLFLEIKKNRLIVPATKWQKVSRLMAAEHHNKSDKLASHDVLDGQF